MWPFTRTIVVVHRIESPELIRSLDRLTRGVLAGAKLEADAAVKSAKIRVGWNRPKTRPAPVEKPDIALAEFKKWLDAKGWDKVRKDDYLVKFARYCGRPCSEEQLDDATRTLIASGAPLPQAA